MNGFPNTQPTPAQTTAPPQGTAMDDQTHTQATSAQTVAAASGMATDHGHTQATPSQIAATASGMVMDDGHTHAALGQMTATASGRVTSGGNMQIALGRTTVTASGRALDDGPTQATLGRMTATTFGGATDDHHHMQAALALARRGLGSTWPNPSVGCVLVRNGCVVGRGTTASGGRPHAEAVALAMAGPAARGATAYVTLEPCSHHGQTPPCADALIAAGIACVVIAGSDPDPRVNGAGIARLRAAGIEVITGLLAAEADAQQAGFLSRIRNGRPMVTLKLATTLDGRIATRTGASQWITGPDARRAAHALRGRHDAVMVGIGTVLADDPDLTCRIPGFRRTPLVRIVLDSTLRTPPTAHLVTTAADTPTWIIHGSNAPTSHQAPLLQPGVRLIPTNKPRVDLPAALQALGAAGLTRVLAEGGAGVAAALMAAGLVDRIAWFHAPALIGGDGLPAVQSLGVAALDEIPRFTRIAAHTLGDDMLTELQAA